MIWPRGHMGVEALTSLSGTQCICIFIHRSGRRKHARKQLTRQIENKHRKNTYRCWIHILYHRISKKHKLHVSVCCCRIFDLSTNLNGISFAPIASIPRHSQHPSPLYSFTAGKSFPPLSFFYTFELTPRIPRTIYRYFQAYPLLLYTSEATTTWRFTNFVFCIICTF